MAGMTVRRIRRRHGRPPPGDRHRRRGSEGHPAAGHAAAGGDRPVRSRGHRPRCAVRITRCSSRRARSRRSSIWAARSTASPSSSRTCRPTTSRARCASGVRAPDEPIRIASEFANIADHFARERHFGRYSVIPIAGASEGYVPEDAEILIEGIETGSSVRANKLTVLERFFESTNCVDREQAAAGRRAARRVRRAGREAAAGRRERRSPQAGGREPCRPSVCT